MRVELRYGFPMRVTVPWSRRSMVRCEVRENSIKVALSPVLELSLTILTAIFASATPVGTRLKQLPLTHMTCRG